MKKAEVLLSVCIGLTLLCGLFLSGCTKNKSAFTVNGLAVERAELVYYMRENSAIVAAALDDQGLDSSREDFWTAPQNGVDTFAYLQEYTVQAIARVKLEQLCAKRHGLETPLYYSEQREAYILQNEQRVSAYNAGEVIYGPVERDFVTYFNEWYLEMQLQIIPVLAEKEILQVTIGQIEDYYAENRTYFTDVSREEAIDGIREHLLETAYNDYIDEQLKEAELVRGDAVILPEEVF